MSTSLHGLRGFFFNSFLIFSTFNGCLFRDLYYLSSRYKDFNHYFHLIPPFISWCYILYLSIIPCFISFLYRVFPSFSTGHPGQVGSSRTAHCPVSASSQAGVLVRPTQTSTLKKEEKEYVPSRAES